MIKDAASWVVKEVISMTVYLAAFAVGVAVVLGTAWVLGLWAGAIVGAMSNGYRWGTGLVL